MSTEKARTIKEHSTYMERVIITNSILSKCSWKLILNLLQKEKLLELRFNSFSFNCCVSDKHPSITPSSANHRDHQLTVEKPCKTAYFRNAETQECWFTCHCNNLLGSTGVSRAPLSHQVTKVSMTHV